MGTTQEESIAILKALADQNRLRIVDMLSCGEICACRLLEHFHITQPTLSHHMKVLMDCGLVIGRRDGVWMHYSLNRDGIDGFLGFLGKLTGEKEDYICEPAACCGKVKKML